MSPINIHASAVVIEGAPSGDWGILIRGAARSGKSALALSLIRRAEDAGLAAALVADDRVSLEASQAGLAASAPAPLAGLMEISGVGLFRLPARRSAILSLVADLQEPEAIARLPESEDAFVELAGVTLRRIVLPARQAPYAADVLMTLIRVGFESRAED